MLARIDEAAAAVVALEQATDLVEVLGRQCHIPSETGVELARAQRSSRHGLPRHPLLDLLEEWVRIQVNRSRVRDT